MSIPKASFVGIASKLFDDIYTAILGATYTNQDIVDCYEVAISDYILGDKQWKMWNKVADYQAITIDRLSAVVGKKEAAKMWGEIYIDEMKGRYLEAKAKLNTPPDYSHAPNLPDAVYLGKLSHQSLWGYIVNTYEDAFVDCDMAELYMDRECVREMRVDFIARPTEALTIPYIQIGSRILKYQFPYDASPSVENRSYIMVVDGFYKQDLDRGIIVDGLSDIDSSFHVYDDEFEMRLVFDYYEPDRNGRDKLVMRYRAPYHLDLDEKKY